MSVELGSKRLGLLHELIPGAMRISALINPTSTIAEALIEEVQTSASIIGSQINVVYAPSALDIDAAFAGFEQKRVDAAVVSPDVFFTSRRVRTLAAYHRIPVIYGYRGFAEVGGLMTYGPNLSDQYRQLGIYAGRLLKGEEPAKLPVARPTWFELVINLQTAKTLKLSLPEALLALADEVIE
jgi:putative tryptophan/tyrosine transport system substrate-binding protein